MQGIRTHCVGASWVMHRLCWLCISGFGLVRAFLNLGPSCWTNCLVLYAFAPKKEAAWNKTCQVKGPCIVLMSSCHLGLLTQWKMHLFSWLVWDSGEQEVNGPKERQNGQGVLEQHFPSHLTGPQNFPLSGMSCPGALGTLTFCSAQESNLFSLLERTNTKSLCILCCITNGPGFI